MANQQVVDDGIFATSILFALYLVDLYSEHTYICILYYNEYYQQMEVFLKWLILF